uniref:Uncharacterized protein n=1 Tax=Cucumis melo TaxID=3656 RepID=A0A9I9E869_CUCME
MAKGDYDPNVKVGELEAELFSYNELVEYKLILQKDFKRNQYDAKRLPMITFGYSICSSMVLLQEAKHHYAKLRDRVDSQTIE